MAIDSSAAAIRILNVVIVVLRVVLCGELALAITAAWLRTFPADFSVEEYVGVASENARRVNITLARHCVNEADLNQQSCPIRAQHASFQQR